MTGNVREAIPFFRVGDMEASLKFYVEGLGFKLGAYWNPDGPIRWCSVKRGGATLMLQTRQGEDGTVQGKAGEGVSIMFLCDDALALYREAKAAGLSPDRPFVGNGMWVVGFDDPDGYRVEFESDTDVAEETEYVEGVH